MPEFEVELEGTRVKSLKVIRGAPCGATFQAAKRLTGCLIEEALVRIGIEAQFFCTANPAGWDPFSGKSPVHFAGDIHHHALVRAFTAKAQCIS